MNFYIDKGTSINLFQLMKASGLSDDYKEIRLLINKGVVSVNGQKVFKQREELFVGDIVQYKEDQVIILEHGSRKTESRDRPELIKHGKTHSWKNIPVKAELDLDEQIRKTYLIIHRRLLSNNLTLAVAESCTGGMLQQTITSFSGCSEYFLGGVVSYSNLIKKKILKVKSNTLDKFGAVSKEICLEMVTGINNIFQSDISISITGLAGPKGATEGKPIGAVYIGIMADNKTFHKAFHFSGSRDTIRKKSVLGAIEFLSELTNS